MKVKIDSDDFEYKGDKKFSIKKADTKIKDFYENDEDYEAIMDEFRVEMDNLQSMMYAHNKYGLLIIFQAMDAAGKDGTIKHVLSGVNPSGVNVISFKKPSMVELKHDFLWRTNFALPSRGTLSIFNRSYYEEVLVLKVHPELLETAEMIPEDLIKDPEKVFEHRYNDICNHEKYLAHNGFVVLKFFLNVSKAEQGKRLIERIEDQSKNWKFGDQDINERIYWKNYMGAYEECINQTSSKHAPWYVIPADEKKNMRLIVSKIILSKIKELKICYPVVDEDRQKELIKYINVIKKQDAEGE